MKQVGAFEAKTHFSSLLDEVEKGEQVTITKHGRPVAKIIPFNGSSKEKTAQAISRIRALSLEHSLGDLDWKTLRDEGRR
jgi:prevent-host-death family protein